MTSKVTNTDLLHTVYFFLRVRFSFFSSFAFATVRSQPSTPCSHTAICGMGIPAPGHGSRPPRLVVGFPSHTGTHRLPIAAIASTVA